MANPKTWENYGLTFTDEYTPLHREYFMIQKGGQWKHNNRTIGLGLYEHYRRAEKLTWPSDDEHRWATLDLQTIVENEVSVFLGSGDSTKTYNISRFILTDWWAFSENTLWLVSSTELRGAELRIWGTMKQLFNRARDRHEWLPGQVLEAQHAITTEQISKDQSRARLLTKGLIFIPCMSNGKYVGMGKYVGIKPVGGGRLGHAGDEVQAMQRSFLDAYSNWYGKQHFRGIMAGNPFDIEDCLCVAAEPVDGWASWRDTEKTQTWRSKFYDAAVVAHDGRDSPNNDFPIVGGKVRYPYIIGPKKLKAVERTHGKDTWQYYNQCIGKPRPGSMNRRVITRQLCEDFNAFDDVFWSGAPTTKIGGCDAAYGGVGGDRCVTGHIEFGEDVLGNIILAVSPPVIVPVSVKNKDMPEDQIATFCKQYCEINNVPPENFFFDARSTLAMAYARLWSPAVNALDFGGNPTDRPVSLDTFVWDGDERSRRLQLCKELYSKFVTELWFCVHYIILSNQMRRLPKEVAEEGYKREWNYVKGNRMEVETKKDMKERTGHSPDLFDWLVICCEGARRRGFEIKSMSNAKAAATNLIWLETELAKHRKVMQKLELSYK